MKRSLSLFAAAGITLGLCLSSVSPALAQAAADPLKRTAIIGDSITNGYGTTSPSKRYTNLLNTTFTAQGRGVNNFGVDGATALRWLNCPLNPTMQGCKTSTGAAPYAGQYTRLSQYQPTTVLIALGTNELIISRSPETYATQMIQLAQRVYSLVPPGTLIAFVHHYDVSAYGATLPAPGTSYDFINSQYGTNPRPTWNQYRTALSTKAAPNGVAFIDISDMNLNRYTDFIADKAHIDDSGHQIYYDKLNAFLQAAVPPPTALKK